MKRMAQILLFSFTLCFVTACSGGSNKDKSTDNKANLETNSSDATTDSNSVGETANGESDSDITENQGTETLMQQEVANSFYQAFTGNDFEKAFSSVDETLAETLKNANGLETLWNQTVSSYGDYESTGDVKGVDAGNGIEAYFYPATFANQKVLITITATEQKISGLFALDTYDTALTLLDQLMNQEYGAVYESSSADVKKVFQSEDGLKAQWETLIAGLGAYQSAQTPVVLMQGSSTAYTFTCTFENGMKDIKIVVTEGKLSGLFLTESTAGATANASDQVNINALAKENGPTASTDLPEGVEEKDIIVNQGTDLELYGKLTYPAGQTSALPVIVLVQGSGSSDMDETIYENKPFKDIAYGLSTKGIAVLRYNKSTYSYPQNFSNAEITTDEETVNDAVAAKQALLDQSGLTFSHYYVAGHSLGGMLAPKIASVGGYDGMIILAGSTRSLLDIQYDQNMDAIKNSEENDDKKKQLKEEVETVFKAARETLALPEDELKDKTILGLSAMYYYTMENPSPEEYIKELQLPMLILQGTKDIQVYPDKDYPLYADITKDIPHVVRKEYDGLNHLFMLSPMDPPSIEEYKIPSHVDNQVMVDIANWIEAIGAQK